MPPCPICRSRGRGLMRKCLVDRTRRSPTSIRPPSARSALKRPSRLLARLLCPRQLHPQTSYQAFVVPTFERGRLAGLGDADRALLRASPRHGTPDKRRSRCRSTSAGASRPASPATSPSLVAQLHPVGDLPDEVWQRDSPSARPAPTRRTGRWSTSRARWSRRNTDLGAWTDPRRARLHHGARGTH